MGILDGVKDMFKGKVPPMTWKEQCRANKQYVRNRGSVTPPTERRGQGSIIRGMAIKAREVRKQANVPFNKHKADKQLAGLNKIDALMSKVGVSVL